jgi:hypothetical protein
MKPWLQNVKTAVKHPWTQLVCGLILFISGTAEIWVVSYQACRTYGCFLR